MPGESLRSNQTPTYETGFEIIALVIFGMSSILSKVPRTRCWQSSLHRPLSLSLHHEDLGYPAIADDYSDDQGVIVWEV